MKDGPGYENGVIMRGAQTGTFLQHIPVPAGMWNPIRSSSVPLHIFGPSIITIEGRRAAILVCYEQFLTWPVLKAALERPNLLVVRHKLPNIDLDQAVAIEAGQKVDGQGVVIQSGKEH